jgi:hypothetical protein
VYEVCKRMKELREMVSVLLIVALDAIKIFVGGCHPLRVAT